MIMSPEVDEGNWAVMIADSQVLPIRAGFGPMRTMAWLSVGNCQSGTGHQNLKSPTEHGCKRASGAAAIRRRQDLKNQISTVCLVLIERRVRRSGSSQAAAGRPHRADHIRSRRGGENGKKQCRSNPVIGRIQ
jgi:hypothetical protein